MTVALTLPDDEARALYGHIHRLDGGEDAYPEAYRQLQNHFFQILTVDELRSLLGDE